jgi:two-component system chemotaxis sensor kinase CheA
MDVILEATDLVKVLVADIRAGEIAPRDTEVTIGKLAVLLDAANNAPLAAQASEISASESVASPEVLTNPEKEKAAGGKKRVKKENSGAAAKGETPSAAPLTVGKDGEAKHDDLVDKTTVRVDVKRLDDLMNQMGELVLERNRMMQLNIDLQGEVDQILFNEEFAKLAKRLDFVTSELQMQVLKMRMIPVGNIFKKFPRIIRTMARDLDKQVDLIIIGEETELDRSVVDEIGDPLIHLIRNALDHGIETPDERVAAGKSRMGKLVLAARHEGNQIVISIKDDGRGIDPAKLARKALEKGLITEEQLAVMGEREILDLVFLPGFSTKEKVTDLSGRGVGMDVVRTNIKRLNGIIDIQSEPGRGSEFILKLPLTLAIIKSLLVEVENETYSLPLSTVIETLRVQEKDFHWVGGQEVLRREKSVLPLLRLDRLFGVRDQKVDGRLYHYVVVVGVAEKRLGLVVTRLLGQQEIAIKSLGRYLSNVQGIAGSTILGDGRVTLIIDPANLIEGIQPLKGSDRLAA